MQDFTYLPIWSWISKSFSLRLRSVVLVDTSCWYDVSKCVSTEKWKILIMKFNEKLLNVGPLNPVIQVRMVQMCSHF